MNLRAGRATSVIGLADIISNYAIDARLRRVIVTSVDAADALLANSMTAISSPLSVRGRMRQAIIRGLQVAPLALADSLAIAA